MEDTMTIGIPKSLAALIVPLETLKPYGANPRTGNVDAIAESLEANGQYRPVVVNSRTDEILAGNHTYAAALQLGWSEIAATFVDADEEQAARIVLVDNRSSDLATYKDQALAELLLSLPDLAGTGFDQDALDALLASVVDPPRLNDPDDAPALPEVAVSQLGSVWLLGPHRLVVGDATDPGAYKTLLGDERADLIWTDPPYGVAYVGSTKDALTIKNDRLDRDGLTELLRDSLGLAYAHTRAGACWYVAAPHGPAGLAFATVLSELDVWRHSLVWVKNTFAMGRADYHYRHEPLYFGWTPIPPEYEVGHDAIYYGWTPGAAHQPPPDRKQDTVWEIDKPARNAEHPTMKPVELVTRALNNSTDVKHIVLDPFAGSGSTLIAAHMTSRVARLLELDPKYADVICRRYQEHTGDVPVLEATGETHDFTEVAL